MSKRLSSSSPSTEHHKQLLKRARHETSAFSENGHEEQEQSPVRTSNQQALHTFLSSSTETEGKIIVQENSAKVNPITILTTGSRIHKNGKGAKTKKKKKDILYTFNVPTSGKDHELNVALEAFKALIYPVTMEDFFENYYQHKPLHLRTKLRKDMSTPPNTPANDIQNYRSLFSTDICKQKLADPSLQMKYGHHIDIARVADGKRETHSERFEGNVVDPEEAWKRYEEGWTMRILHPQEYHDAIYRVVYALQTVFKCISGVNIYLTPPSAQGFSPHWDDVDVFVVQLEGRKQWLLHPPMDEDCILPRYSSRNFSLKEVDRPSTQLVLEEGEVLYLPRGCIHQARTIRNSHSMHATFSINQRRTWTDCLEKLLPIALERASKKNLSLRYSIPTNLFDSTGTFHEYLRSIQAEKEEIDDHTNQKRILEERVKKILHVVIDELPLDSAMDMMMADYCHGILPPNPGIERSGEARVVKADEKIELTTRIRIISPNSIWLVVQDGNLVICHSAKNTRVYQEIEPQAIEIPLDIYPAIELLKSKYPAFITPQELPLDDETKLEFVTTLANEQLLETVAQQP